jgi:hypothetical protein
MCVGSSSSSSRGCDRGVMRRRRESMCKEGGRERKGKEKKRKKRKKRRKQREALYRKKQKTGLDRPSTN